MMKYLFFDIECSVVSKTAAKICAFGYCLCDEQFHILDKRDILINPQGSFHLTDKKGTQGLVLPYRYEDFKQYPTFLEKAEEIYSLLQDKETLVAGHATMNDVKYLNLESKRFSLPSFSFRFADTQFLYMNRMRDFSRQFGLGVIAKELGVDFLPHRAVDDAYATMKIAEAMCKEEELTFSRLLQKYEITLGSIDKYTVTPPDSASFSAYRKERETRKEEREKRKAEFYDFADREKRKRAKNGLLKGKNVCFSHALELDLPLSKKLLQKTFACAGFFTSKAETCDFYICFEGEKDARLLSAQKSKAHILTPTEYFSYLGE